jgi:hypothetical protein
VGAGAGAGVPLAGGPLGWRAIFDGSLPDLALTREPVRRLGSLAAAAAVFLAAWGYGSALVGLGRRRSPAPDPGGPLEEVLLAVMAIDPFANYYARPSTPSTRTGA